jgi:LacI family transcriptional regulator
MKVTIVDLAQKLKLSPSTVSRALKDDRRISKEVRKTVTALAEETGYRPNLLARSLVKNRSYSIGFIMNDISWSFFSELSQFIQDAAETQGYSTFLYSSADNAQKEKSGIERSISGWMDGLILFANESQENIEYLESLTQKGFPIVVLNNLPDVNLDIVSIDNAQGACQIMEHLHELGHRRIAYIGPKPRTTTEKERLAGYEKFLKERIGAVDRSLIFTGKAEPLFGYYVTKKILRQSDLPTAFVAYNDTMAFGIMRAISEMGLKIPEDLSVVGFDGLSTCLAVHPTLTTVGIPLKQLANLAFEMLLKRIERRYKQGSKRVFAAQKLKLVPELIIRNSTGKVSE